MEDHIQVTIPTILRQFNDGNEIISIPCCKADQIPAQVAGSCPALGTHLFNKEGLVSGFINIYINGVHHEDLNPEQSLSSQDRVEIVTSLVGG